MAAQASRGDAHRARTSRAVTRPTAVATGISSVPRAARQPARVQESIHCA
jgi:hypothetical protein